MRSYDVAIVGAGTMGSWLGYELTRRGLSVLLVDQGSPPHSQGAHHGESRLYRQAYSGPGPYTALALEALDGWLALERVSGRPLFLSRGVLNLDHEDSPWHHGKRMAARQFGLRTEFLGAAQVALRWPAFRLPPGFAGLWEPDAGILEPGASVAAALAGARAGGADLVTDVDVRGWDRTAEGLVLRTPQGTWRASRIVVTAGTSTADLVPGLRLPVERIRKVVAWFATTDPRYDSRQLPGFTFNTEEGQFYGFPSFAGRGVKIGRHDGGATFAPGTDPEAYGKVPDDGTELGAFVGRHLPGIGDRPSRGAACRYDRTPDEGFRIGRLADQPVWYATGFSGHGFKFAPAIGRQLALWVATGETPGLLAPFGSPAS